MVIIDGRKYHYSPNSDRKYCDAITKTWYKYCPCKRHLSLKSKKEPCNCLHYLNIHGKNNVSTQILRLND